MEPEVEMLRNFRDEKLLTNEVGQKFVEAYYKTSPPMAKVIENNETLKMMTRTALAPIVYAVKLIQE